MIVLSGALVLVALVLLVFGALDRNLPYVYASIGVSVLSLLLLVVGILQRRGELDGDEQEGATQVEDSSAEQVPALVGAEQQQAAPEVAGRTAELVRPAPAGHEAPAARHGSRRVEPVTAPVTEPVTAPVTAPVTTPVTTPVAEPLTEPADEVDHDVLDGAVVEGHDELDELDEPDDELVEELDEPDDELVEVGSGTTVLVVSGRPRYHLEGCRVLRGKQPQPLDRDVAREHGFSPCGVCKPDADESAAAPAADADEQGSSFTEALFGGPLFAGGSSEDDDRTSAEPDRPVQPAVTRVEPAVQVGSADVPAAAEAPSRPTEPTGDASGGSAVGAAPDEAPELPAALRGEDPAEALPAEVHDTAVAHGTEPHADTAEDEGSGLGPELPGHDPADEPEVDLGGLPVAHPTPDVAADPDELPGTVEPDLGPAPQPDVEVTQPVRVPTLPDEDRVPVEAESAVAEVPAEPAAARAPAKQGGAKKAPAKKAPATKAPAKKAPAKKASARKAPAKQASAEQAPATTSTPPAAAPAAPRRPLVRAVRADALRLGAPSTGVTTTRVAARAAAPAAAAPVVVVPDRDRFHRPACRFVRDVAGATSLPRASATRQGYAACGVCKP